MLSGQSVIKGWLRCITMRNNITYLVQDIRICSCLQQFTHNLTKIIWACSHERRPTILNNTVNWWGSWLQQARVYYIYLILNVWISFMTQQKLNDLCTINTDFHATKGQSCPSVLHISANRVNLTATAIYNNYSVDNYTAYLISDADISLSAQKQLNTLQAACKASKH